MKFSWRANWEILLVLVIIVVGIVITTIAAIRNKDKTNPLVLAEEADFGQLLAGANSGNYAETATSSPNGGSGGDGSLNEEEQPTRRPLLQAMLKTSRPSSGFHPAVRDQQHQVPNRNPYSAHEMVPRPVSKYEESNLSEYNRHPHHNQATLGPGQPDGSSNLESYDAMSTEPTPNQIDAHQYASMGIQQQPNQQHSLDSLARLQHARRPHFNRSSHLSAGHENNQHMAYGDQMSESVDLIDDIHTTRSSLASQADQPGGQSHNQHYSAQGNLAAGTGVLSPQLDQIPITPSLALYAPYGVTPTSLQQLLAHTASNYNNHKLESQPASNSMMDTEDMMTSYTKIPGGNSSNISPIGPTLLNNGTSSGANGLTEAMIRDFQLATFGNQPNSNISHHQQQQQQQVQLINSAMLANLMGSMASPSGESLSAVVDPYSAAAQLHHHQQQAKLSPALATHHRTFSASLPISMLLADLLKLARPHHQVAASTPQVASVEPAATKHHSSILQQLRSLPGPLMALLQGLSSGNNQQSAHADLASLINHDASESSQHYHRVSMSPTDVHSILARSLHTSGVLPAFPAPKGVPQNWVSPNAGGNPNHHAAQNSNADFVAGNAAGFVRAASNEKSTYQQPAANSQQQQQSQANTQDGYQRSGNNEAPSFGGGQSTDNSNNNNNNNNQQQTNQQHFQRQLQQHSSGLFSNNAVAGQEQADKQQQHPVFPANHSPGNAQQPQDRVWPTQQSSRPGGQGLANNEAPSQELNARRIIKSPNILPQGGNNIKNGVPDYAAYLNFQQSILEQANQQLNSLSQMHNGGVQPFNHAPTYNSRIQSADLPSLAGLFGPAQHQRASAFEFNGAAVESAPKASVASSNLAVQTNTGSGPASTPSGRLAAPAGATGSQQAQVNQPRQHAANHAPNTRQSSTRRRRSIMAEEGRVDEVMSGKYGGGEEDDDSDAQPISVVRPDGQPTNSGRVRGFRPMDSETPSLVGQKARNRERESAASSDRQVAQSQRTANHLKQDSLHYPSEHYMSLYNNNANQHHHQQSSKLRNQHRSKGHNGLDIQHTSPSGDYKEAKKSFEGSRKNNKKNVPFETASSGLMSKLLGTASNTDETEEDADDDEDANEKRKEELEDAEFGIANDERQLRPIGGGDANSGDSPPPSSDIINAVDGGSSRNSEDSGIGSSGSNDNEAFTRRNQQRSDIEFYGHPGEETRTLKYGILGSGNYEVVNGGIYPEADESTAAVNSVANYVRKPGSLLNGLPKLLSDHSGGSQSGGPQSSYIPGSRLSGYMRGASANPDDLVGLVPSGPLPKDPMGNPMLELIEANGAQLFDPNMMAHLGSSSRTIHATRDSFDEDSSSEFLPGGGKSQNIRGPGKSASLQTKNKNKANKFKSSSDEHMNELNEPDMDDDLADGGPSGSQSMQQQQSSISGSRSHGANQFNSYQILPSKKVTIFSDQDLDSAPSELEESRIHYSRI